MGNQQHFISRVWSDTNYSRVSNQSVKKKLKKSALSYSQFPHWTEYAACHPQKRSRNTSGLRHQSSHNLPVPEDLSSSSSSDAGNTHFAMSTNGEDPDTVEDEVLWDMKKPRLDEEDELVCQETGDDTNQEGRSRMYLPSQVPLRVESDWDGMCS